MIKKNISIVRLCIVMFLFFLAVALPADLSAQTDVTPPVLVDLSFTPTTFDVSGGDQDVVFTWTLTDDTGVGNDEDTYTYLEIISPSETEFRYVYVSSSDLTSGDMTNGVFETTVTFPQYYSETGTWKIQYVLVRDALGNYYYHYTSDLAYMGFNTDLIVSITPTADAGPDQTVDEGVTVTLDASNSSDPDNGIASYLWEQTDGTSVTLSDCASDQPTFTAPDVGPDGESLTFQLTVTDNGGLQAQDTCIVNVSWVNIAPTAVAGSDQTIDEGATATLDASNSSDPDDGIASYLWEQTSGTTVTLSDETAVQPAFTAPDVGPEGEALTFELTVTDYVGLQSTDTCIVNVSWLNIAPTAVAGSDQTVGEGVIVTLDASNSSDPDDGIASYLWEQTDGTSVTLSDCASDQPTFTAPDVGPDGESLTFQLTVTDNGGLQAQDTCIVSVLKNTPPYIPTAIGPANEATVDAGPVTLKTSAFSDPDGDTHLQTHWLVRRYDRVYKCSDYDASFDHVATSTGLIEHTVSGLEPGLKYVWKAGYVDSGSGDTSWSEEYTFKIGTSQADSSVWIEPGTEATDFKMVSFIQWPDDPVSTSVFGDEMGESYDKDFRMGTYDPTSSDSGGYVEYGSNLIIEPGRAYWFLARDGLDITVNGVPVSEIHNIELGLLYNSSNEDGWNMIACPNNADYYWGDVEVVEYDDKGNILYGPTAISELGDDPNDYIDKRLWAWENGSYSYYPDPDDFLMKKYEGYWVKVKKANVFLRFPVSTQAGLSNLSTQVAIPDPDDSPPAPIGNFSVTPGGAGGDVGCFIATASYGSPMEGHVKTLSDFRDSYLLSYSILNHGPTITAIMLVFTLVFPIFFVSSYRRKMKG